MCFPESTGDLSCGTGTIQMGDACVPDGSVICTGNTIFDTDSGTCVVDPDAICEGDLVFVTATSTCVDPDSLLEGMADVLELAEPNDPEYNEEGFMPQEVDIADGTGTFFGCVEPTDFDDDGVIDADFDFFRIVVDEPTLLNVNVDGIGGANGAVAFLGGNDTDVADAGWQRFMIDLSGDGASGQIFLPDAGTYFILATDGRSLLFGEPAGGPDNCYFVQLEVTDIPTPTPITVGTAQPGTFGDPTFFSLTATEGQLLFTNLAEVDADGEALDNANLAGSMVNVVDDDFQSLAETDGSGTGGAAIFGLRAGEEVLVVVDHVFNLNFGDVDFELTVDDSAAQEMPEDGTVTFTHDPDLFRWVFFEATEGDVVKLSFDHADADDLTGVAVFGPAGSGSPLCAGDCADGTEYIAIGDSGVHYVRLYDIDLGPDETTGPTYDVNFTRVAITPAELTLGTAGAADLATHDRGFFTVDTTTADWINYTVTALTNLTEVQIDLYPLGEFGVLDVGLGADDGDFAADGDSPERIPAGMGAAYLVSVSDADGHDMDETFSLTVDNVAFTDLGTVDETTPATRTGEALAADGTNRYLVRDDTVGEIVTVALTNVAAANDLVLRDLAIPGATTRTLADDGLDGEGESFVRFVSVDGLVAAFRVNDFAGAAGTYDVTVSSVPPPYSSAPAVIDLVSVCPSEGGTGVILAMGDDSVSADPTALPASFAGFEFFGEVVTDFYTSTNGFISFDAPPAGSFLGDDGNIVSPFDRDLVPTEVCGFADGDTYTIEYRGATFGGFDPAEDIEFQVILHATGEIDFVYGAGQVATNLAGSLVGLRNADNSIELNSPAGVVEASTAFTWTPTP
jgi:hypothetical protein